MVELMDVTGSTMGEVLSMSAEELMVTRQAIGQRNRNRQSDAGNAGKGLPPGVGK